MRYLIGIMAFLYAGVIGPAAMALGAGGKIASHSDSQASTLDLTKTFHTRSAWRLVVTEGAPTQDYGGDDAPGPLTLCLHKKPTASCISYPVTPPIRTAPANHAAWEPHYLLTAKAVYPKGPKAEPFLLIITGSLNSGDGDQIIATQLVTYDADHDTFRRVYEKSVGHNNNQEVRFVTKGVLRGRVITAEPKEHLPYGYWITVNSLTSAGTYRQVLRYRSATRYNDRNPLAVIDSETPNIEKRLGLWRTGQPIPSPDLGGQGRPCLKPTLRHAELWCG